MSEEVCNPNREKCVDSSVVLASHALVNMIRRLTSNWKQVVAYYLTGSSVEGSILWQLVKQIVVDLSKVQIIVRAVVCDIGTVVQSCYVAWCGRCCKCATCSFVKSAAALLTGCSTRVEECSQLSAFS